MSLLYGSARIRRLFIISINPGCDLLTVLEDFVKRENIKTGVILSGVGSLKYAKIRNLKHFPESFPVSDRDRLFKEINGPLEILSLTGNVAQKEDGEPMVHAHICLSYTKNGEVITLGGHLVRGCITYIKVEIVIAEFRNTKIRRTIHPERKEWELSFK